MQTFYNPAAVIKPRLFGRGRRYVAIAATQPSRFAEDLRLFAMTFACGFLFVSVFIA